MTVKELIEKLQEFSEDTVVVRRDYPWFESLAVDEILHDDEKGTIEIS